MPDPEVPASQDVPAQFKRDKPNTSYTNPTLETAVHQSFRDKWLNIWKQLKGSIPKTQKEQDQLDKAIQKDEDEIFATGDLIRKQQEKAEKESFTDALTGLPNRRAFDRALERAYERVRRVNHVTPGKASLAAIMLDLDHFKMTNDTLGHQGGDEVLKAVAEVLDSSFNRVGTDFAGRYGGEEFVILVENRFNNGAGDESEIRNTFLKELIVKITENVSAKLNQSADPKLRDARLSQTASIGVSDLEFDDKGNPKFSKEDLIGRADKAVYKAKADGRDRVISYTPELAEINTGK